MVTTLGNHLHTLLELLVGGTCLRTLVEMRSKRIKFFWKEKGKAEEPSLCILSQRGCYETSARLGNFANARSIAGDCGWT
jgi:hypothetical protein